MRKANVAWYGKRETKTFDLGVTCAYANELVDGLDDLVNGIYALKDILFWRGGRHHVSAALCVGTQLLISLPTLIPATLPLAGLAALHLTRPAAEDGATRASMSVWEVCKALIFGNLCRLEPLDAGDDSCVATAPRKPRRKKGQAVKPAAASPGPKGSPAGKGSGAGVGGASPEQPLMASFRRNSFIMDDEDDDFEELVSDLERIKVRLFGSKRLRMQEELRVKEQVDGLSDVEYSSDDSDDSDTTVDTDKQQGGAARKVGRTINQAISGARRGLKRASSAVAETPGTALRTLSSPLQRIYAALEPVQERLRLAVFAVRSVRHVLRWQSPILSALLYLAFLVTTVAAALAPWSLIWHITWHYAVRMVAFALFGPHMHHVGRWLERRAAKMSAREREFAMATSAQRAAMLDAYRQELLDKARAGYSREEEEMLERRQKRFKFNVARVPSRSLVYVKHFQRPDPSFSQVHPLGVTRS